MVGVQDVCIEPLKEAGIQDRGIGSNVDARDCLDLLDPRADCSVGVCRVARRKQVHERDEVGSERVVSRPAGISDCREGGVPGAQDGRE